MNRKVVYNGNVKKLSKPDFLRPSDSIFEQAINNLKTMTKPEMWKALSGKTVKCIYTEDKNSGDKDYCLFAVQDLDNLNVYILDEYVGEKL